MPLVKRGAKSIGKEFLKSETNFVSDILEGKNLKQAALNRTKETGSNVLRKVATFSGEQKSVKKTQKEKRNPFQKQKEPRQTYSVKMTSLVHTDSCETIKEGVGFILCPSLSNFFGERKMHLIQSCVQSVE